MSRDEAVGRFLAPPGEDKEDGERRRAPRIADGPPLRVAGVSGTVQDISRAGICLQVDAPVLPGQRCHLTLTCEVDGCSQEMDAEGVWYNGVHAGFRWIALTPEQDRWLLGRFQAWLRGLDGHSAN